MARVSLRYGINDCPHRFDLEYTVIFSTLWIDRSKVLFAGHLKPKTKDLEMQQTVLRREREVSAIDGPSISVE